MTKPERPPVTETNGIFWTTTMFAISVITIWIVSIVFTFMMLSY